MKTPVDISSRHIISTKTSLSFYPKTQNQNPVNLLLRRTPSKDIDHNEVLYTGYQLPPGLIQPMKDQSLSSIIYPPDLKINSTTKMSFNDKKQSST